MKHVFKVKNVSSETLKIEKIGTSCGCTAAILSDSTASKGETAEIQVNFIPNEENVGKVENTIVFTANTNPKINMLQLKGIINK